jgi:hypothetical protein
MPTLLPGLSAQPYRFVWLASGSQVRGRFTGINETSY